MNWIDALQQVKLDSTPCVLISVVAVEGSAPRGVGARMLVDALSQHDTIGGGSLEHKAVAFARDLLRSDPGTAQFQTHSYSLGAAFSQCCGGRINLQFEVVPANLLPVVVFGAGHVANAIAVIAAGLPWHTRFVDSREQWLKSIDAIPAQHGVIQTSALGSNPFLAVETCPDNAYYLVMTHDHDLDFELIEAILSRGDSRYCGLIASRSKAASFTRRLRRKGFTDSELAQLTSPIGASITTGKMPTEVAVAAVADVMSSSTTARSASLSTSGLSS